VQLRNKVARSGPARVLDHASGAIDNADGARWWGKKHPANEPRRPDTDDCWCRYKKADYWRAAVR